MARIASTPLIFGSRKSIKVTSGLCCTNSATASSPVPVCATTLMSERAFTIEATPTRSKGWSSTIITLIFSLLTIPPELHLRIPLQVPGHAAESRSPRPSDYSVQAFRPYAGLFPSYRQVRNDRPAATKLSVDRNRIRHQELATGIDLSQTRRRVGYGLAGHVARRYKWPRERPSRGHEQFPAQNRMLVP